MPLLGQPKPTDVDPTGAWYAFEKGVDTADGKKGWADVWLKGKFGWEYKRKHRDLRAAYQQLQKYREALENPPLLVVCDPIIVKRLAHCQTDPAGAYSKWTCRRSTNGRGDTSSNWRADPEALRNLDSAPRRVTGPRGN